MVFELKKENVAFVKLSLDIGQKFTLSSFDPDSKCYIYCVSANSVCKTGNPSSGLSQVTFLMELILACQFVMQFEFGT